MKKYRCNVCGYIYDPAEGDPTTAWRGTAFEDLPDTWLCPGMRRRVDGFALRINLGRREDNSA